MCEKAVDYYRLAAEQGDPRAQANLRWMYEMGYGVHQNRKKALSYYRDVRNLSLRGRISEAKG
ncbi:hypothetical protein [Enterovibrio norvegicus]|uniref:hypothetical protein n=1 Tax=Enterovibrio norvegicus TaxID=188144 RepID=UPI003D12CD0A